VPIVLLDEQMAGDVGYLRSVAESADWQSVATLLELRFATFDEVGLASGTPDRDLWDYCQANGFYLLTDNRNAKDDDSLEVTIRNHNTPTSLPIFNVSDRPRLAADNDYASRVVVTLMERLIDADNLRGTGRHYLP
jgi:hypothetical protein